MFIRGFIIGSILTLITGVVTILKESKKYSKKLMAEIKNK